MVRKIIESVKEIPLNGILILVCLFLYYANNLFFKSHTSGVLHYILVCHFNDYLAGILFVAYSNLFIYTRKKMLFKVWHIVLYCFLAGIFWEFPAIYYRKNSTPDWIDVLCYILGGFTYWVLLHIYRKLKKKTSGF